MNFYIWNFGGVFIKIKIKGYLKNLTENTIEIIDTYAIMNSSIIKYQTNNTKYTIKIDKDIILIRDNEEINHQIIFKNNKITSSEYFLKKYNSSLEFNVLTIEIQNNQKIIYIKYKIIETENIFEYKIEMSENK